MSRRLTPPSRFARAACLVLAVAAAPAYLPVRAAAQDHDLHLVLAFDVSASINDLEFDLQRFGTARAFRAVPVVAAIEAAPGGVAVAIVQWSSIARQAVALDWTVLRTRADAFALAGRVQAMQRKLPGGGTMIHAGLDFAAERFRSAPGSAVRRVIDLSGNGETDDARALAAVRARLLAEGVVINALAVEELGGDLTAYFRDHLIGGPDAFVETAPDFEDFQSAMERKLYREIAGRRIAGLGPAPALR